LLRLGARAAATWGCLTDAAAGQEMVPFERQEEIEHLADEIDGDHKGKAVDALQKSYLG
jgi:hypothetical protein